MKQAIGGLSLVCALFAAAPAMAINFEPRDEQCEMSLNYDISLEPKKLSVSNQGKEHYRIEPGRLYVEGEEVALNVEQSKLVNEYSDAMAQQLPEVISLVDDAVTMASEAVSMALTPLLGDAAGAKLDEMGSLQQRVYEVAHRNGDQYFLGATEESLENAFGDEFSKEIEQLVQQSLGSLMMAMGSAMMSGEGETFDEKINAFSQKMEKMGKDIEVQMESRAQEMEQRADALCDNFQRLLVLEDKLRKQIPELGEFQVLSSKVELQQ
ncbi:YggN family protein [Shewanella algae]|uniref:YggN family protein n=1 Tax=Shewanella algae TaxID=38313 RepID=UPI0031F5B0D7